MRYCLILLGFILFSCGEQKVSSGSTSTNDLTADEALAITAEAYVFGYPLILMDMTKNLGTNTVEPHPIRAKAPVNQLGHYREFPDPQLRVIVKPNVDTYYSIAWLDLKEEPIILSMPATERYYLMQFMDGYTDVFASLGTRTTGTAAQEFMIVGPKWQGEAPDGLTVYQCSTEMAWLLGRIQTNSEEDGRTVVRAIQDGMRMYPLSARGDEDYKAPDGVYDERWEGITPIKEVEEMEISEALKRISELMVDNPPSAKDSAIVARMAKIGMGAGVAPSMDFDNFVLKQKLKAIPKAVGKKFRNRRAHPPEELMVNNWTMLTKGLGNYGVDYRTRALVSFMGLGANLTADAVYPNTTRDMNGAPLDGANKYVIHMEKDELPPVNIFWSVTAYNEDEFLISNEINRYSLGSHKDIKYNEDGSFDLYIQAEAPEASLMDNWLPCTKEGSFGVTMRLYWPKAAVYEGTWSPPNIVPVTE